MDSPGLEVIRRLLADCSPEERQTIFRELRQGQLIHEFEQIIGAPAEMILEAVHRAPELTRRMLRGVIADAAFRTYIVPVLQEQDWEDVTPQGNHAFDYKLDDGSGPITVQVKLQRSAGGTPVERDGAPYGMLGRVFMTETQKTRSGSDGEDNLTRPYRYGEFDVLAVSMQPSTRRWDRYMYTLGRWLLPGDRDGEMGKMQPVAKEPDAFWTNDFTVAAAWYRAEDDGKRMALTRKARVSRKRKA